jgi:hypothetical protein
MIYKLLWNYLKRCSKLFECWQFSLKNVISFELFLAKRVFVYFSHKVLAIENNPLNLSKYCCKKYLSIKDESSPYACKKLHVHNIFHFHVLNCQWDKDPLCLKWLIILRYCGVFTVRGGPTFMDLVGHIYPRIYIPTNKLLFLIVSIWYYPKCIIYQLHTK